jgi:ribosomal protein S18 acetylase RimI-like enzyme
MSPDSPAIAVRDARPDEFPAVAALLLAAYDEYRPAAPPNLWGPYAQSIADVQRRAADSTLIVAEVGGELAGAVTYYADGSRGENWPPDHAAIRLLAVHPNHRGLGLGRALMQEAIRRARADGQRCLGLHTTALMATAKAMYLRMGFTRRPETDMQYGPIAIEGYALELTPERPC